MGNEFMNAAGQMQQSQGLCSNKAGVQVSNVTIDARLRRINDSNGFSIERLEYIIHKLADADLSVANPIDAQNKLGLLETLTDQADGQANRLHFLIGVLERLV